MPLCEALSSRRGLRAHRFVKFIGGAAAWPTVARGQQPAMPVVGFLSSRLPDEAKQSLTGFRSGLRTTGYVDGQNVVIEYRWADGEYSRLPGLAADLVRRGVAVLVATGGEPSALAAKVATSTIPIVFTIGGDPVKVGLVGSLNRPGGNATGVSLLTSLAEAKRLGLLNEVIPGVGVLGVLINPNYQQSEVQSREVQEAARTIGRPIQIDAGNDQELEEAFATLAQRRVAAMLVTADPFFTTRRDRIIALAAQLKLPAIYEFREYTEAGGLMSYGISLKDGYHQAGIYTGQVLKGARPADLPVQQSTKFEFVINLKTAKTLGVKFSENVLSLADDVIE
jgi:putative tryptophan/tyrosine transport system substrate-binding protein